VSVRFTHEEIGRLLDRAERAERELRDLKNHVAGRSEYVAKQVKAVESVLPLLALLVWDEPSDCYRLTRVALDAYNLPRPEEILKLLGPR
jgi:hypothetical protein